MSESTFQTVRDFVDHVGRKRLKRQRASPQLVYNWIQDDRIPANWISVFTELYDGDLPLHLFHMREPVPDNISGAGA